jgi:methylenetetrahydrofolate--tRNA-(uracil-5-)-methyltransferase
MRDVAVVGGGLAGSELALQLAGSGIGVLLIEMRPAARTPAHATADLAELVCSNSLKSDDPETASGLLKRELRAVGCRLLEIAAECRVSAGHALAVDRAEFSHAVTSRIESNPRIRLERREQRDLDLPECAVIATGPLTSDALSGALRAHFAIDHLSFYDAISLSVSADSIDPERAFKASRYGKGGDDYWNIPLDADEYRRLVRFLRDAPKTEKRGFEETRCFESCLPVEVIAGRGEDALRFGPLKPKGLCDPRTGREPYAAIQLRQETRDGTLFGLVGFQTRLTRGAQQELLEGIPGFRSAEILRWGSVHRNTFLDSPRVLDEAQMSRARRGLFFAGQLVGVEGYMESIASGVIVARNVARYIEGNPPAPLYPRETLLGALQRHCCEGAMPFQPMNVNFGLLPPVTARRAERKTRYVERSLKMLETFLSGAPLTGMS